MEESDETKIWESATDGVLKGLLKNWKPIASALGFSGIGIFGHFDSKHEARTEWPMQVGQHLMDNHNEIWSNKMEIMDLSNRVSVLENKLK